MNGDSQENTAGGGGGRRKAAQRGGGGDRCRALLAYLFLMTHASSSASTAAALDDDAASDGAPAPALAAPPPMSLVLSCPIMLSMSSCSGDNSLGSTNLNSRTKYLHASKQASSRARARGEDRKNEDTDQQLMHARAAEGAASRSRVWACARVPPSAWCVCVAFSPARSRALLT